MKYDVLNLNTVIKTELRSITYGRAFGYEFILSTFYILNNTI